MGRLGNCWEDRAVTQQSKLCNLNYHLNCAFWITQHWRKSASGSYSSGGGGGGWSIHWTIPHPPRWIETTHGFTPVLRSVHTREVIAIFELRSVHTRDRIQDFAIQLENNVWVPCQSNMHGARISCASVHMQHTVYRRKWLEGHLAQPPQITIQRSGHSYSDFAAWFARWIT